MTEEQYQRYKFLTKHRKDVPDKDLRIMFNKAWGSCLRLGNIINLCESMVWSYKMGMNNEN